MKKITLLAALALSSCAPPANVLAIAAGTPQTRYQVVFKVDSEAGKETVTLNTESIQMCQWFQQKAISHGSWVDIKGVSECREEPSK